MKRGGVSMRKICCFAGHSRLYGREDVYEKLLSVIEKLIQAEDVAEFWVGHYGDFDKLCSIAVRELKEKYPHIRLYLIVPYLTAEINEYKEQYYKNYDGILIADIPENTPKRLMIIKSNEYMVKNAKYLVCYVTHSFGGAARVMEYAKKKGDAKIINIGT